MGSWGDDEGDAPMRRCVRWAMDGRHVKRVVGLVNNPMPHRSAHTHDIFDHCRICQLDPLCANVRRRPTAASQFVVRDGCMQAPHHKDGIRTQKKSRHCGREKHVRGAPNESSWRFDECESKQRAPFCALWVARCQEIGVSSAGRHAQKGVVGPQDPPQGSPKSSLKISIRRDMTGLVRGRAMR